MNRAAMSRSRLPPFFFAWYRTHMKQGRPKEPIGGRLEDKTDAAGPTPRHCPELGRCHTWTGAVGDDGYGVVLVKGKTEKAHRVAWERAHGPIPAGGVVMHRCDNRRCMRLKHMRLGTKADNTSDMMDKGRQISGNEKVAALIRFFARFVSS